MIYVDCVGLSVALIADLSGISSFVRQVSSSSTDTEATVRKLAAIKDDLNRIIASPVPRAVIFGQILVCPARYAATHQFQTMVCLYYDYSIITHRLMPIRF